jgi:hypothetical protein
MDHRLHIAVAVLAIAALAGGVLSGCACAMPQAATASHDCCETADPAISADQGCCGGAAANGAPVVLVTALHAAPAHLAAGAPVAAAVPTAACKTSPLVALTSAPPLILRI